MTNQPPDLRTDQLAPHSIEAEEAVLGAILINPDALLEVPFLTADMFFIVRHAWIWEAMQAVSDRGEPLDYLTVCNDLDQAGRLAEVGGAAYVLRLIGITPSALNCEGYGRIVERMALRRRLIEAAGQIARIAHSEETDIEAVIDQSENAVFEVTGEKRQGKLKTGRELADAEYDRQAYLIRNPGVVTGVKTYLRDVDAIFVALPDDELHIIASRPGIGKTGILGHIIRENAKDGVKSLLFSLEMSEDAMIRRLLGAELEITQKALEHGHMKDDFERFCDGLNGATWLSNIVIDDTPRATMSYIRSQARTAVLKLGVRFVCVDYIQLMGATGEQARQPRHQQVSFFSSGLKVLARELRIPIIAASQLNRACEERQDKRPLMVDLAESDGLSRDPHSVSVLYREGYYDESAEQYKFEWIVRKHRNGQLGTAHLYFKGEFVKFGDGAFKPVQIGDPLYG